MNILVQYFLNGFCGFVWVVGFFMGLVILAGVLGVIHTLIGVIGGGEDKDAPKES